MKYLEGQLYIIEFLDHVINHTEPVTCQVVGWLIKEESTYLVLNTWYCMSSDPEIEENNRECVVIIKSTITHVYEVV
jgi:hypothetical protein